MVMAAKVGTLWASESASACRGRFFSLSFIVATVVNNGAPGFDSCAQNSIIQMDLHGRPSKKTFSRKDNLLESGVLVLLG